MLLYIVCVIFLYKYLGTLSLSLSFLFPFLLFHSTCGDLPDGLSVSCACVGRRDTLEETREEREALTTFSNHPQTRRRRRVRSIYNTGHMAYHHHSLSLFLFLSLSVDAYLYPRSIRSIYIYIYISIIYL